MIWRKFFFLKFLAFIRVIAKVEIPLSLSNWVTLTSTPIYYIFPSIQSLPNIKQHCS